ncbi:hypothetical protein [Pandoraea commovens]|uniref:Uncharacterized protein n=1 Tax=Pandoraea commovens TaxID=2508289 RepID=A0A5E4Z772_9BURK|nr:hypothetical protein [Pandoraea commovens]UVA80563.1 hypothetical protein NTU39_05975 [Pandoraea commovens]VVE57141.1 hypothetical protein PCO31010_05162 [Pandoraea commovens]
MEVSSTGVNSGAATQALTGSQGADEKGKKAHAVGEDLQTVSQILTPQALKSTEIVRSFEVPDKLNEIFGPRALAASFNADTKFLARFQEAIVSSDDTLGVFVADLMGADSKPRRQKVVDALVQSFEYVPDASRVDAVKTLLNYRVDEKGISVDADGVGVIALRGFSDEIFETIPETDKAHVKDLFEKHEIELDA